METFPNYLLAALDFWLKSFTELKNMETLLFIPKEKNKPTEASLQAKPENGYVFT